MMLNRWVLSGGLTAVIVLVYLGAVLVAAPLYGLGFVALVGLLMWIRKPR